MKTRILLGFAIGMTSLLSTSCGNWKCLHIGQGPIVGETYSGCVANNNSDKVILDEPLAQETSKLAFNTSQ